VDVPTVEVLSVTASCLAESVGVAFSVRLVWTPRLRRRASGTVRAPELLDVRGTVPPASPVALYVHWDPSGEVSAPDLAQLRHLRALGRAVVVVGNRDDGGSGAFADSLDGVADVVLQRHNVGYDFAGFRDGLLWLRPALAPDRSLLVMNNSTYGPFGSLAPLLAAATADRGDVWAVTGSLEVEPHVQTYLMLFHPRALASEGFWLHWAGVRPPREKMRVVYQCEVPLAVRLHNQGLRVRALRPYHDLARHALGRLELLGEHVADPAYVRVVSALRRGAPLNPTHHLWRWLVDSGVPLAKKDMLRLNPPGLPDVESWESVVDEADGLRELVADDVARHRMGAGG
jgi:Rhamnan synthesis protein F